MVESGKPVLEFISIQRSDNKEWALPGVSPFENLSPCRGFDIKEWVLPMGSYLASLSLHRGLDI